MFRCFCVPQQTSASIYLINLLVADLLLLLALPFKITKDLGVAPWNLMVFHCQASAVTIYISLYASIAFLAFIITDRYLQVSGRHAPCGLSYVFRLKSFSDVRNKNVTVVLQECHTVRSLRLQEVGFARLLSLVVWLLLLLIMVPNMALPIKQVKVRQQS